MANSVERDQMSQALADDLGLHCLLRPTVLILGNTVLVYIKLYFFLQKISGRELKYTALVGKPSELTYHHADYLLHEQALKMGMNGVKTLYCIG